VLTESWKNSQIEEDAVEMHDPNVTRFAENERKKGGQGGSKRKRDGCD